MTPQRMSDLERACADIVWLHQSALASIAEIARPFLDAEREFLNVLGVQLRRGMAMVSDEEIDEQAQAIVTLARCGVGSAVRQ